MVSYGVSTVGLIVTTAQNQVPHCSQALFRVFLTKPPSTIKKQ